MKSTTKIIVLLAVTLLSSCGFYQPSMVDIPLITEKNDVRVDVGGSINPSLYATVSYGLTDKIALQAFAKVLDPDRYYVQGAFGLYKSLLNNRVVEWYSGVGYGYSKAYNDANPGYLTGNYSQIFTQLNYGKTRCRFANMDFGVGLKAGYVGSNRLLDDSYYYHMHTAIVESHNLLIEPQAFLRLGGKKLKVSAKVGYGVLIKLFNTEKQLPFDPLNLGIGLNYSF